MKLKIFSVLSVLFFSMLILDFSPARADGVDQMRTELAQLRNELAQCRVSFADQDRENNERDEDFKAVEQELDLMKKHLCAKEPSAPFCKD